MRIILLILNLVTQFDTTPPIFDGDDYYREFQKGMTLFYSLEYREALEKFLSCKAFQPNDQVLLLYIAHSYYFLQDYEQADYYYSRISRLSEEDMQKILFNRALCYLRMDNREATYAILLYLKDIWSTNPLVYLLLADMYFEELAYENAKTYYHLFLERFPMDLQAGYAYYHLAYIAFLEKQFTDAAVFFANSLSYLTSQQVFSELYYNQSLTLLNLENEGAAAEFLADSLDELRYDDPTYIPLIRYHYYYQNFDRVVSLAEHAIESEVNPDPWLHFIRGVCASNSGDPAQALVHLNLVDTENSDVTPFQLAYYKGITLFKLERYSEAKEQLLRAQEYKPDNYDILAYLITLYYKAGDVEKAAELIQKATSQTQNNQLLNKIIAFSYTIQGQWSEAQHALESYLQSQPNDVVTQINLGYIFIMQNKLDQAQQQFDSIIDHFPTRWEPYYYKGWIYHTRGNVEQARVFYEQALPYTNRRDYHPYVNLAAIYAASEDLDHTLEYLEKAYQKGFRDGSLLENEASFDLIREQTAFQRYIQEKFSSP
jgi:tetratricopeptide (TPR) repeat protein